MGRTFPGIDDRLAQFLLAQPVFFVATAPTSVEGSVNVSPKGVRGSFAVLGPTRVAYLDFTGSGVETIAHLRDNGRIVVMFCAFQGPPRIVRVHGRGRAVCAGEDGFSQLAGGFPAAGELGVRAVVTVDVTRVSDSCGYGVPLLRFEGEREVLAAWARKKGRDGIAEYQRTRNATSIDGLPGLGEAGPAAGMSSAGQEAH